MTGSSAWVILLDKPGTEAGALLLTTADGATVSVLGAMSAGNLLYRLLVCTK